MGKVTIILESDNVPTSILYEEAKDFCAGMEDTLMDDIREEGTMDPDIRVYVVPGDEP